MKYRYLVPILVIGPLIVGYVTLRKAHPALLQRYERRLGLHPGNRSVLVPLDATLESAADRERLPEFQNIAPANSADLTAAMSPSDPEPAGAWTRSQGDAACTRYSPLTQINRSNIGNLQTAWIYHSKDGRANIQCTPVIAHGVLYAPTAGNYLVALRGDTGAELWRFQPGGRPAQRGLVYWPGSSNLSPRLYFTSGDFLFALDPSTGKPVHDFGKNGRLASGGVVAPAIYQNTVVVANWNVLIGYDIVTGKQLWRFDVLGKAGSNREDRGGNCWGGMAMDTARGIVYASTGSPHPNFVGFDHVGRNEHANSVIALEAKTGRLLWSFQELRHDIWDLDIPAPPNLVTITHDGRRVDAVAQVTKLGNTLLLDRLTGQPLFPYRLRRAPVSRLPGERTWPYQPIFDRPEPFARQVFTDQDVTDLSPQAHDFVAKQIASANRGWMQPFDPGKPTVYFNVNGGAQWTGAAFDPTSGWLYVSSNEIPWIMTVVRTPVDEQRDPSLPPSPGEKVYRQYCADCHNSDRTGKGMAPSLIALNNRMLDDEAIDIIKHGRNAMPPIDISPDARKSLLDFIFDRDFSQERAPSKGPHTFAYVPNGYPKLLDDQGYPGSKPPWGTLNAIDLNSGKIVWKVPLGEYEELTRRGIATTGTENFGGATVTAGGVVFCAGTRDLKIRGFDKGTGRELWSHKLPFGGFAPPAVYEVNGREYVVIASTGGGKLGGELGDAYVAFALPKDQH